MQDLTTRTAESVLDALKKARALISNRERWTQGAFARDEYGAPVGTIDEYAVCWCAHGAVRRVSPSKFWDKAFHTLDRSVLRTRDEKSGTILSYNDQHGRKHEDVIARFDDAIRRLEEVETG